MLGLKDLIAINREFHEGRLTNSGSLEFAIDHARRTTNWTKALAYVVRALLIDRAFEDGNKRTAAAAIMTEAYVQGFTADKDRVARLVVKVLRSNVTGIREIEEMIKDAI